MEGITTLSVPLSETPALCSGEGAVFIDFQRPCPSTVGSKPKGQNVILSGKRARLPLDPFLSVQTAGQHWRCKGATSRVPVEGSGLVGTGRCASRRQKTRVGSLLYPWRPGSPGNSGKQELGERGDVKQGQI